MLAGIKHKIRMFINFQVNTLPGRPAQFPWIFLLDKFVLPPFLGGILKAHKVDITSIALKSVEFQSFLSLVISVQYTLIVSEVQKSTKLDLSSPPPGQLIGYFISIKTLETGRDKSE